MCLSQITLTKGSRFMKEGSGKGVKVKTWSTSYIGRKPLRTQGQSGTNASLHSFRVKGNSVRIQSTWSVSNPWFVNTDGAQTHCIRPWWLQLKMSSNRSLKGIHQFLISKVPTLPCCMWRGEALQLGIRDVTADSGRGVQHGHVILYVPEQV